MNQTDWQELRAFLAQPQDLSQVVPGDALVIHERNYNGPPPDIFFEIDVRRITEDNRLVYGHPHYERAFDWAGLPKNTLATSERAYLPSAHFDQVFAWQQLHDALPDLMSRCHHASNAQLIRLYRLLRTFPQDRPEKPIEYIQPRRMRRLTRQELIDLDCFCQEPEDLSAVRKGQRAYWYVSGKLIPVKIARATRKSLYAQLPPDAGERILLLGDTAIRKFDRRGNSIRGEGLLHLPRWEMEAWCYWDALEAAIRSLFAGRRYLASDEQLAALRCLLESFPPEREERGSDGLHEAATQQAEVL